MVGYNASGEITRQKGAGETMQNTERSIDGAILYKILSGLYGTFRAARVTVKPPEYALNPRTGRTGVCFKISAIVPAANGNAGNTIAKIVNERTKYHCPEHYLDLQGEMTVFEWVIFLNERKGD
jgi:hypothetical protein